MWQEACGILERSLKTSGSVQRRAHELQVLACVLCGCSVLLRGLCLRRGLLRGLRGWTLEKCDVIIVCVM